MEDLKDILLATVYLIAAIGVVMFSFYALTIAVPVIISVGVIYMIVQVIKEDRL